MSVDKENHTKFKDWHHWCRLCAKENAKNVDFFFKEEIVYTTETRGEEKEQMLLRAIRKYFDVDITNEEQQSSSELCPECFSLIFSLVNFNKRVAKVQEMFNELHNLFDISELDILTLRVKYGVSESDHHHEITIPSSLSMETHSLETNYKINYEKVEIFKENYSTGQARKSSEDQRVDIKIKEESSIDGTPTTADEDVCDIENDNDDDNNDEDPFGSEIEIHNGVDTSLCSIRDEKLTTICIPNKKYSKSRNKKLKSILEKSILTAAQESPAYKYFCSECPQRFQRVGSYSVHLRKKHGIEDVPKFTCSKCSRSFQNAFNLKRHMETHRPTIEKKIFPCPQCDRKFQTKDYVATHIKFVHEDIRPLICEECGEGARTQGALREHMLTHTDYAPFECEICKKCFKNQIRLKNHMEIHSTDKHQCSECGLQLNSRVTLNRHMLVHSDVMHHKCDYCGRAFKRAKTLKSHLILHSGIKPYSCEFCDRTFTSGSNCRTHMKRQHPNELADLEASGEKKYTKNIPKLAVLKSVMKTADNLRPVVSKQTGSSAVGKKPAPQHHSGPNSVKSNFPQELVLNSKNKEIAGPQ